jgi:hypothetical protein
MQHVLSQMPSLGNSPLSAREGQDMVTTSGFGWNWPMQGCKSLFGPALGFWPVSLRPGNARRIYAAPKPCQ